MRIRGPIPRRGRQGAPGAFLLSLWLTVAAQALAATADGARDLGETAGDAPVPAWFKASFLDLPEEVRASAGQGRRLLLYFHQNGCPYCRKLIQDNFGQREIAKKTRRHFDVIALNLWGDHEVTGLDGKPTTEKGFAAAERVMFTPTLIFLDEQGREVARINGYFPPHQFSVVLDYVAAHKEQTTTLRDYLAAVDPPAARGRLHSDPTFLKPPYRLDPGTRSARRPLLVLFEQGQCRACDELHEDVFQRPATRALLAHFDVVLLDMWSITPVQTPDGTTADAAAWARRLGVVYAPTLVFFDAGGHEVFRAEAYLKAFHLQSALDYVASGAYRTEPNFQRYIRTRADTLRARGVAVDLMK